MLFVTPSYRSQYIERYLSDWDVKVTQDGDTLRTKGILYINGVAQKRGLPKTIDLSQSQTRILNAYPNPLRNNLIKLDINSNFEMNALIAAFDFQGKELLSKKNIQVEEGISTNEFELPAEVKNGILIILKSESGFIIDSYKVITK